MKLADVFVTINGHLLGPFVTVLPQDARGADLVPAEGDTVHVIITPRASGLTQTRTHGKLRNA